MAKKTRRPKSPEFTVGDRVSFTFGLGNWDGIVIEDRGPIGVGGRRLYGVRFPINVTFEGEEQYAELPAERLNAIKKAA
jgi:hypothetical protein